MKNEMYVGVIGLGAMGGPIAKKLFKAGVPLAVYDINPAVRQEFINLGIKAYATIEALSAICTVIWVMIPANAVESMIDNLCVCVSAGTVIIDGGNSFYKDTIQRAEDLQKKGIAFLDCGTSGGLWGAKRGFSLTIGGDKAIFKKVEYVFQLLASSALSYSYVGPSGAGHYVKMVHNGIEYALMQSYAEGFALLKNGHYKDLDLASISGTWLHGSIIRGWILNLCNEVFSQQINFDKASGAIGENGTGRWCVEEAHDQNIPVTLIEDALRIREKSRNTGGDYSTKIVSQLRHIMGGHAFEKVQCITCLESESFYDENLNKKND